mmetsp:Transcript_32386/g.48863  ORF Transcript_32386/g.48863 Transcript_32386/m.48863 type:complete len:88 (+) Transcript_32386:104-367(+)|eukprot:CAMPEP_0194764558 /NCGR_PEP_ID=MMETSP0323_2-20130528/23421_1 /TAXON_ID=2866 ORGANISM="Crypthecodinium cohnii, Strain Seligo" /NCGR_SAMPLE_ID=MMETSP0323_2 /ASSEMBLY_ACC=CAM_ASM_000346 /LENGTH=87 /DNA_ID=CAMNT_0039692055 /DNA_START=92 /DNA_END=355 /DNA_ORIENTATION=+
MAQEQSGAVGQGANSVVILPSCLFHVGNTQREQDLLKLPPPSCSPNPGSSALFQLRTKTAMGAPAGHSVRNTAAANAARKSEALPGR